MKITEVAQKNWDTFSTVTDVTDMWKFSQQKDWAAFWATF
jgi:hypothetical protein